MPRVESDALADQDLAAVFLAVSLAEARRAEELLTLGGINYVVQVEAFGRTLFGSTRYGAIFYVVASQAPYCGRELAAAGLEIGVLVDHE